MYLNLKFGKCWEFPTLKFGLAELIKQPWNKNQYYSLYQYISLNIVYYFKISKYVFKEKILSPWFENIYWELTSIKWIPAPANMSVDKTDKVAHFPLA
jgi:hypothetical protein